MATKEKRGRGRPATGETPKRYFRLDDASWEVVVKAAEIHEQSTSEYIRQVILKDAERTNRKKKA